MDVYEKAKCIKDSVLSEVSGIHWGSWNISPKDKEGPLYNEYYSTLRRKKIDPCCNMVEA